MFAVALYPADSVYLNSVQQEVHEQVRSLTNSIVHRERLLGDASTTSSFHSRLGGQ